MLPGWLGVWLGGCATRAPADALAGPTGAGRSATGRDPGRARPLSNSDRHGRRRLSHVPPVFTDPVGHTGDLLSRPRWRLHHRQAGGRLRSGPIGEPYAGPLSRSWAGNRATAHRPAVRQRPPRQRRTGGRGRCRPTPDTRPRKPRLPRLVCAPGLAARRVRLAKVKTWRERYRTVGGTPRRCPRIAASRSLGQRTVQPRGYE